MRARPIGQETIRIKRPNRIPGPMAIEHLQDVSDARAEDEIKSALARLSRTLKAGRRGEKPPGT